MLGLNIYHSTQRDIHSLGRKYRDRLIEIIQGKPQFVLKQSRATVNDYHRELVPAVYSNLRRIGMNAVNFYGPELTDREKEQEVNAALDTMTHSKYYGLTLPERLKQSNVQLHRNLSRSAVTGAKQETRLNNITRVFTEKYPYGAHMHWDTRLFLAEAVRLEHEVAKRLAYRREITFVRWTMSHTHEVTDICDELSQAIDPAVATELAGLGITVSPAGVYFVDQIPSIPHPNCQCVLKYVTGKPVKTPPVSAGKRGLVERILRALFSKR